MKNSVFTIIVTYNGIQWIKECIDSVIKNSEVIVVDNNSSDNTIEFINKNYKDVVVLKQNKNLGFGAANNIGISYAIKQNAKFVLLLNQDAKLKESTLQKLEDFAQSNTNYGIVSPIHCDWSGNYLEASFTRYINYKSNKDFISDSVLNKTLKEVYNVPFVAAACWFMPINAIKKVGGFDPIFFHSGEDNNLTQRLNYHNFKIGILPNCFVCHDTKNRTFTEIKKFSEKYYFRNDYHTKIEFANINIPNVKAKIKFKKKQILKQLFLAILQLKIKNASGFFNELKRHNVMTKEVHKSRKINVLTGMHYLD